MDHFQGSPHLANVSFRRLDVNRYMVTFFDTDMHTPDMIAWVLKDRPEHQQIVSFVGTKKAGLANEKTVDMEIHLKKLCDVAELVATAARQAARSVGELKNEFDRALATAVVV